MIGDSFDSVIRRFFGDDDVVHVPFAMAGGRDADQLGVALQRRNIRTAAISHPRSQTADKLVNHRRDAALVGDASLDSFGDELLAGFGIGIEIEFVLEVSVAAAAAHRAERTHAAVLLEAAALVQNHFAGTLVGSGEEAADHHGAGARPRSPW